MSEQSDDQLFQMLEERSHLWLIRGGPSGVLAKPCETLRAALVTAYDLSMRGELPGPIVRMPNDSVRIPAEQIYHLWQRLGMPVRR